MSRLEARFAELKARKKCAFIPFVMGGDPDYEISLEILNALPAAGADIIEIGIPFADPMADGPVIQEAGERALKSGMTLTKTLELVKAFRKSDLSTPIILMGYANPLYCYGLQKFCRHAAKTGVDGLIVVDLPPEESADLEQEAHKTGLDLIRLVTPTSNETRLPKILNGAGGFLYYVAVAGVTGTKSATSSDLEPHFQQLRQKTGLPLGIGFGIKTAEHVKDMARIADAVIVGSTIVSTIAEASRTHNKDVVKDVTRQVRYLSGVLQV